MEHCAAAARTSLDDTLAALQAPHAAGNPPPMALGIAVPDGDLQRTRWRVGPLQAGPGEPDPPLAQRLRTQMQRHDQAAIGLLQRGGAGDAPPRHPDEWQRWLVHHAPAYRLLSPSRDPAVLALWLGEGGQAAGALRLQQRWQPLAALHLPGPEMLRLDLRPMPPPAPTGAEDDDPATGRYSRLAGVMGRRVLQCWQRSVVAVVGCGRTGSLLAHTLVRAGASVLLLDPDHVELHNLCGDVLPQHEGLLKSDAVARMLRALVRPGAFVDARSMDIGERAAGLLLQGCDTVITCVDDDRARLWAAAWCSALLLPHLDIGVAVRLDGEIGADLRLIVPGEGCLGCVGGFARPERLPTDEHADARERVRDFREQRAGSLRTWAQMASHAGLRLMELMYAGTVRRSVFRRMREDRMGRLTVTETDSRGRAGCPLCSAFHALGRGAVMREAVLSVARALAAASRAGVNG